ncbi:MAG TPA: glutamine amidotransferase [Chloroflexota bacterium]|nr:glutamine amidotransferase [Chloroflexota bacterium]
MSPDRRVLIAGESWVMHTIHQKGFDSFTTTEYAEGVSWLRKALERAGYTVDFMPNHLAPREFPFTVEELSRYTAVILSDIGANSLSIHPDTFARSHPHPNRLAVIREYVRAGGALVMIGGYLTFQGIEAKGAYRGTPIEEVLPVTLLAGDDRVELPDRSRPEVVRPDHDLVRGLPHVWPRVLGYNRLQPKDSATVLVTCNGDPFVAVGEYGRGRTLAFAGDCGPHWAPVSFVEWDGYDVFWAQAMAWLSGDAVSPPPWAAEREAELQRVHAGLQEAQRLTRACMEEVKRQLRTGMTEREVHDLADAVTREHGSSGPWYSYVVAFGENTLHCDFNHPPGERRLEAEDIVLIDLTPVFHGFYGDYTETIAWGGGGAHRQLIEDARAIEQATLAFAEQCSTPDELFAYCYQMIQQRGYRLLDHLGNIGHSIGPVAYLDGFIEAGNVRPLRGGWALEPFIGNDRAGAKFEDILFFQAGRVDVMG